MGLNRLATKQIQKILDISTASNRYVARSKNGFAFIDENCSRFISESNFVHNIKDLENILQLRLEVVMLQAALRELRSGDKDRLGKYIDIAKERTKDWPKWKRDMFKSGEDV